jgi:RNA polymerase sigma factor (sigma-70 family)
MATGQMHGVVRHLRRAALLRDGAGLTDGQLLERYVTRREEAAFEALLRRHGPMVFGVCRRLLSSSHDAEDAFQATFLVLVRKSASIVPREMVGNWLHGVAYHTALKAKAVAARRRAREKQVTDMPEAEAQAADAWQELQPLLDQELNRLPDKYRLAVVLCDLEGRTHKEAARQLGWPPGTLSSRLVRARLRLARRLAGHGLTLSGAALAAALSQNAAAAALPRTLAISTLKAAFLYAAGPAATAGAISARVAALTEGVLKAMLLTKLKAVVAVLLAAAVLFGVAGGITHSGRAGEQDEVKKDSPPAAAAAEPVGAIRSFEGHKAPVIGVVFSPDGRRALTASSDASVRLWDVATGKEVRRLIGHVIGARSVAFSPDGKRALSTGDNPDRTVRLWDLETGIEQQCFEGNEAPVHGVAFLPDGKRCLFGCSADKRLRLLDIDSGNELQRFEGHTDNVSGLALSRDGKRFISCGLDGTVRLWDLDNGTELRQFPGHTGQVWSVAMSPDGKQAISAGEDREIRLWDLESGKELRRFDGHTGGTHGVAFSPNGRRILSGGYDNVMRLWDVASGKELYHFEGHTDAVYDVAFSPDGRYALSGGKDSAVRLWRLPK